MEANQYLMLNVLTHSLRVWVKPDQICRQHYAVNIARLALY